MVCPEENLIVDFVRGDLSAAERGKVEAHIDACPICCEVVSELARIERTDEPVELPPMHSAQPSAASLPDRSLGGWRMPPPLRQGERLGRYVVLDRIGAGGMGVVYSAYDPELDRKVALKLLLASPGGSTSKSQAEQRVRLMREAQAMAKLSHPNVITVHDVGTLDDQVFIAMEFVDGGTLTSWLQRGPHPWRTVLQVLTAAGAGLAAAHAAGLVHRDFKPDNVLLGNDGRVVVTDFGLARPAAGKTDLFAAVKNVAGQPMLAAHLTQTGALVGTPAYMAPEQLAGEASDALSDQFSYCVALYKALYGCRPFAGKTLAELIGNVTDGRVRPPPRDASVPRWVRRAVLRGLSNHPEQRHRSMEELLAALQRDPRRRWRAWASVVLPAGVLAVGLAAWQRGAEKAPAFCGNLDQKLDGVWDQARRRQIRNAFTATHTPFAADAWAATERYVDDWAERWVAQQRDACEAQVSGSQAQSVLALRMTCLSRHLDQLRALGEVLADADAQTVERAMNAAARLPEPELCADVDRIAIRMGSLLDAPHGHSTEVAALLGRAEALHHAAKFDESARLAEAAFETAERSGDRWNQAAALVLVAAGLDLQGRLEEAERTYDRAFAAAIGAGHHEAMVRAAIGLVWVTGRPERPIAEAERWNGNGRAALERLGEAPELRARLAEAMGTAYLSHGMSEQAELELRDALRIREQAFGPDHPTLGVPLSTMGQVLGERGDLEASRGMFERARDLVARDFGTQHPSYAAALDNLGVAIAKLGDRRRAAELHRQALEIRSAALGPDHLDNGTSHLNLALDLEHDGEHEAALEHATRALVIYEAALGSDTHEVATATNVIGTLLGKLGRLQEAATHLRRALEISRRMLGESSVRFGLDAADLGAILYRLGDEDEGLRLMEQAVSVFEAMQPMRRGHLGDALVQLAQLRLARGDLDAARSAAERATSILEGVEGGALSLARARFALARALADGDPGDRARALALARTAHGVFETAGPGALDEADEAAAWLNTHASRR